MGLLRHKESERTKTIAINTKFTQLNSASRAINQSINQSQQNSTIRIQLKSASRAINQSITAKQHYIHKLNSASRAINQSINRNKTAQYPYNWTVPVMLSINQSQQNNRIFIKLSSASCVINQSINRYKTAIYLYIWAVPVVLSINQSTIKQHYSIFMQLNSASRDIDRSINQSINQSLQNSTIFMQLSIASRTLNYLIYVSWFKGTAVKEKFTNWDFGRD